MTTATTTFWAAKAAAQNVLENAVKPTVGSAVQQVRDAFPDNPVHAWPSGDGGAWVVIDAVELGPHWAQRHTWLAFQIAFNHPEADCYPHWVRPDLTRADGSAPTAPINPGNTFDGRPAVMISRRSNRRDPHYDTPARKAHAVLRFLQEST